MNSISLVLALVASHKWEAHQMDVKCLLAWGFARRNLHGKTP
jgi:hypothetical protein